MENEILIVPDVHGRSFWLPAMNYSGEIIFLGDYNDPYYDVGYKETIDNFKKIIEFAKNNKDRVHLLLGNHDLQYLSLSDSSSRTDHAHIKEFFNLYNDNKELFNIAYLWNNTLFTHAGITKSWYDYNNLSYDFEHIDNYLNNQLHSIKWEIPAFNMWGGCRTYRDNTFAQIGISRGGDYPSGGPTWADVSEHIYAEEVVFPDKFQIFGHSQLDKTGVFIHKDNWFMCDSRALFVWNEKELKLYNND